MADRNALSAHAAQPSPGRRGARPRKLSRSADFDRVFRKGRAHPSRYLVLHAFARDSVTAGAAADSATPRLGVSVGRRVGGAVVRNKVKRLLRAAFASVAADLPDGFDYVVVARPDAAELAEREGAGGIERALGEVLAGALDAGAAS